MTTRQDVYALVDRYPDDALDDLAELLSCRRAADGTDLSVAAILARTGARRMTHEEFQEHFGDLPTDGEG